MKRHSKNNRNASNAGNTSELLASAIATDWCNGFVDITFKKMKNEVNFADTWMLGIVYDSYYDFFYDSYESQIEYAKQNGLIDKETTDSLLLLAPSVANNCICKLGEKLSTIIKQWGFPRTSCLYANKDEAKMINRNFASDAFVFLVHTKVNVDVGDKLGSWFVVGRDSNERTLRVSNGVNEMTLRLVATGAKKDSSIVEYCWTHVG